MGRSPQMSWRLLIGLKVKYLVLCGALLLPMMHAKGVELEVGARFPAEQNEKIVVKNDGGVRNETASFGFGEVCYSSDQLRTWFLVIRIVGDQVLVEFECIPSVVGDQTSMPFVQARSRLDAFAADTEQHFMEELQRPIPRFRAPRE
jgi:hypothetical protein